MGRTVGTAIISAVVPVEQPVGWVLEQVAGKLRWVWRGVAGLVRSRVAVNEVRTGVTLGREAIALERAAANAVESTGPAAVRIRDGSAGELESAFAKIQPGNIGQGTGTDAASRQLARSFGNATDDAGHAVGRNLGGLGDATSGNIFPQVPSVNRGAFRQFEQQIARRATAGDEVFVRVVPRYQNGATRPYEILYQVRINGRTASRTFANP